MSPSKIKTLSQSFFDRPTLEIAPEILGKYIVFNSPFGKLSARIVEVEAYIDQDDPACHAARGKTKRNEVMFGEPGYSYIYFIYGMHYCLNFVTEQKGKAAALLLRAAEPCEGMEIIIKNSPQKIITKPSRLLSGPGKFCRAFGLTREQNRVDLSDSLLYLEDRLESKVRVERSNRIGIRLAKDKLWRFYDSESAAVSKP
jgi:DNA-3-methyladenine glycosylase